jgi:hypothetical protein
VSYKLYTESGEINAIGEIQYSDDLDLFTIEMSFKSTEIIDLGTQVLLYNETKEVLRGVVVDREWDKNKVYHYTVFDYGFYLGHNEVIIQFNGCTISEAIKQLLNKINIVAGDIVDIQACVKKIYKKALVSDIIKELLEMATKKTGVDYILRVKSNKVYIEEFKKIEICPTYDLSGDTINITEAVGNFSAKDSIQDMKNSVKINDNKEAKIYFLASAENDSSINTYGKMSVIETPDEDDKTSKQVIANNMLKKLNKITQARSVEMLGSDEMVKGVILTFNHPELGVSGQHLVTSTHHTIDDAMHKVSADIEVYNG